MKKTIFSLLLAVAGVAAQAQVGDWSVGAQMNFGSKNSMAGIGAQVQVEVAKHLRVAPEFIYYFKDNGVKNYNVNLNAQYLIGTGAPGLNVYPIVGLTYAHFTEDVPYGNDTFNRVGANVGCGVEYNINGSPISFFTEERVQILKDWTQSVTTFGIKYKF